MVYPYSGILLKNKKMIIDTYINMDKSSKRHAKEARHKRLHTVWFHLYDTVEKAKLGDRAVGPFWGDRNVLFLL